MIHNKTHYFTPQNIKFSHGSAKINFVQLKYNIHNSTQHNSKLLPRSVSQRPR